MKKSFKILATLLTAITLIPDLYSIKAEGGSSWAKMEDYSCSKRMRSEKQIQEEEKIRERGRGQAEEWRQDIINAFKEMLSDSERHTCSFKLCESVYGFRLYETLTQKDIKSRTGYTQQGMQIFETRFFLAGQNICSREEFKALYLAFKFKSFYKCRDSYGYISKCSIIDLLSIADFEVPETFKADGITVSYYRKKLSITFYFKHRIIYTLLL